MPLLTREELLKKGQYPDNKGANILIAGLRNINEDENAELGGKLGEYIKAISTIVNYGNYKNKKYDKSIEEALKVLEGDPDPKKGKKGFAEFLASGEGKTVYQSIINDGVSRGLSKEELDKSLKNFSDYVGMGLNLQAIWDKQKEFDNAIVIDENAPVEGIIDFKLKTSKGSNFTKKGADRNNVKGMLDILSDAKGTLEDEITEYEKKQQLHRHISDEEKEKHEDTKKCLEGVKKYHSAINSLYNNTDSAITDEVRDADIKRLKDMQGFLEDGFYQTNFKKIIDAAAKNNPNFKADTIENKFNKGIESFEKTMKFGLDTSKATAIKPEYKAIHDKREKERAALEKAKNTRYKASTWIENMKPLFDKKNIAETRKQEGYPEKLFAKIMAARLIAESDRGYVDKLDSTKISQYNLEKKTEEILKKPGMLSDFFTKMKNDPKMLAKAEKAAATGHGGGLDDMFKDYLKKLPAGELQNDKLFERYMPTAKARIEALQTQAKGLLAKNVQPYECAAEILALRNMVKAERKEKSSLDVKIPTDGRNLAEDVKKMAKNDFFKQVAGSKSAMDQIGSGHGGAMINEQRKVSAKIMHYDVADTLKEVNAGTYDGRMKLIAEEAKLIKDKLEAAKRSNADTEDICKAGRDLINETMAMNHYIEKNKPKTDDNIKWSKITKLKNTYDKDETLKGILHPHTIYNADDMIKRMDELATKGAKQFRKDVFDEVALSKLPKIAEAENDKIKENNEMKLQGNKKKPGEISEDEFNEAMNNINNFIGKKSTTTSKKKNTILQ
ncbi:MAG: hypothetical protein IJM14_09735 [Lachnospiraceae bacterium]|nr:hypothetical protein [Lachnospiraceae bacterium]